MRVPTPLTHSPELEYCAKGVHGMLDQEHPPSVVAVPLGAAYVLGGDSDPAEVVTLLVQKFAGPAAFTLTDDDGPHVWTWRVALRADGAYVAGPAQRRELDR
ncbi:MAG TPA: hypothetical protein VJ757_01400, partial [Pseudonocardiaceae bacterium]|nr:hypothetical protein [Pseudonocardiaceae bacterium]